MLTPAQRKAADLSTAQREVLITHALGQQPVNRGDKGRTCVVLMRHSLIRYVNANGQSVAYAPTHTILTDFGREVVCSILADYADALIAARKFLETVKAPPIVALPHDEIELARLMATPR